jgi:hypothetical protein
MKIRAIVIAFLCAMVVGPARAAIVFHIDDPIQTGTVDSVLRFHGSVTNTGPESITMAGFGLYFDPGFPAEVELLSNSWMSGFKAAPGDIYTGEILGARLTAAAAGLVQSVTVSLFSWPDGVAGRGIGPVVMWSNPQTITMSTEYKDDTETPEPGTLAMLAAGLGLVLVKCRRRA